MSTFPPGRAVFRHIRRVCKRFAPSDGGQDTIEYALLTALLAVVAIAFVILVGPYLNDLFQHIVDQLASISPSPGRSGHPPHPSPPHTPHC